jgi:hypothetical protein
MALRGSLGTIGQQVAPYGNGDAARRIVERLSGDLT